MYITDNATITPRDALQWYEKGQVTISGALLALPILPIIVSCLVSVYILSRKPSVRAPKSGENLQRHASITVVMVTAVYIICNLPDFINYVFYMELRIRDGEMAERYNTNFLWNYSWNTSYVFCIVVNSTVNPIIYLLRNRSYRKGVLQAGGAIRDSWVGQLSFSSHSKRSFTSDNPTSAV